MRVHRPIVVGLICAACMVAGGSDASSPARGAAKSLPRLNLQSRSDEKALAAPLDTFAPSEVEAVSFANGLTLRARAVMADPSLDLFGRRREFRSLVSESFDVDELGRVILGDNREKLTARQFAAYRGIITDYLVPIYANKIYRACSGTPEVVSVKPNAKGFSIRTAYNIESGEAPTLVDWQLNKRSDGAWRVLDVAVSGVSLAQSKMEEFDSVLRTQGPDAFLELLHTQAGEPIPQPLASPVAPVPQGNLQ